MIDGAGVRGQPHVVVDELMPHPHLVPCGATVGDLADRHAEHPHVSCPGTPPPPSVK